LTTSRRGLCRPKELASTVLNPSEASDGPSAVHQKRNGPYVINGEEISPSLRDAESLKSAEHLTAIVEQAQEIVSRSLGGK
jgi:hypothetical protein